MKTALVLLSIIITSTAFAADFSVDTNEGKNNNQDRTPTTKFLYDYKKSDLNSSGSDTTNSSNDKRGGNVGGGGGLDLSIPAKALLAEEIFYKQAADFGLSAQNREGWIDTSMQEFLNQAAKSGVLVATVTDESLVRNYLLEVAKYGARAGQAQLLLNSWISQVGKIRKSKSNDYEVTGLGAADLVTLAAGAWMQAEKITDNRIRRQLDEIVTDKTPCRMFGEPTTIQCGATVFQITAPPSLKYKGVGWYGDAYAGVSGVYKVSSNWSWSKALEYTTGNSSFTKKQADELESQGHALEAVLTRKTAVERSKASKTNMGPSKFMPAVN